LAAFYFFDPVGEKFLAKHGAILFDVFGIERFFEG
jgi:hypothetical protein